MKFLNCYFNFCSFKITFLLNYLHLFYKNKKQGEFYFELRLKKLSDSYFLIQYSNKIKSSNGKCFDCCMKETEFKKLIAGKFRKEFSRTFCCSTISGGSHNRDEYRMMAGLFYSLNVLKIKLK